MTQHTRPRFDAAGSDGAPVDSLVRCPSDDSDSRTGRVDVLKTWTPSSVTGNVVSGVADETAIAESRQKAPEP
ncbi:uncharacterized protein HfgLR_24390 (plasmid) [Haloferax gibbonsii]|uniref:Uncharacterized protein n=1 Tax=Haloferax gibbonsii TaxID=35746 RepID=A0A871BM22_HALGI|nr:uncharacterized protein HfgLR_24390 [Haloferax gibbonsii]